MFPQPVIQAATRLILLLPGTSCIDWTFHRESRSSCAGLRTNVSMGLLRSRPFPHAGQRLDIAGHSHL